MSANIINDSIYPALYHGEDTLSADLTFDKSLQLEPCPHTERWRVAKAFNKQLSVKGRDLTLRLAENEAEVLAAQKLRYTVFYEEMRAQANSATQTNKIDKDSLDDYCQHLIVLNKAQEIVGTYRLVTRAAAKSHGSFYTASEYNIDNVLAYNGEILELGRSCVAKPYRTGSTMQLLWQGIASFVFAYKIEVMFGCGSMPGVDVEALQPALSYLHHFHIAPEELRPKALPNRYVAMNTTDKESMNPKAVMATLPPLIKGYLRVGGKVGDGAVIDEQFNTTDICLVLKTDKLTKRYEKHFKASER